MSTTQAKQAAGQAAGAGRRAGRGFSMVEVLLAVFILGIGLIMVAAIFPVGAEWTRQNIEESNGAIIGRNAVAIITTKYTRADMAAVGTTLQPVPGIDASGKLPLVERAYQFGASPPYPAANPAGAGYVWTAMIRQVPQPGQQAIPVTPEAKAQFLNQYDLYIFVFKRGGADQSYTTPPSGSTLVAGSRGNGEGVPYLASGVLTSTAIPAGTIAVGAASGTVYRKMPNGQARPNMIDANYIWAPPADGSNLSPLVYVYQTTVSF